MMKRPLARTLAVVVPVLCVVCLVGTSSRAQEGITAVPAADSVAVAPAGDSSAPASDPAVAKPEVGAGPPAALATEPALQAAPAAEVPPAPAVAKTALQQAVVEVKATAQDLARLTVAQRRKWDTAIASLPTFCQEWTRMLHDREVNNLLHLNWHATPDGETATYTGYGQVEGCLAKESSEGVPIGKVTYEERDYALSGKSIDEAKIHPLLRRVTTTLEIFSFENDRWFY